MRCASAFCCCCCCCCFVCCFETTTKTDRAGRCRWPVGFSIGTKVPVDSYVFSTGVISFITPYGFTIQSRRSCFTFVGVLPCNLITVFLWPLTAVSLAFHCRFFDPSLPFFGLSLPFFSPSLPFFGLSLPFFGLSLHFVGLSLPFLWPFTAFLWPLTAILWPLTAFSLASRCLFFGLSLPFFGLSLPFLWPFAAVLRPLAAVLRPSLPFTALSLTLALPFTQHRSRNGRSRCSGSRTSTCSRCAKIDCS